MFYNYQNYKKDLVIIPKNNDKHNFKNINKVDVKPSSNKSYENIRKIVQKDEKDIEINSIPKKEIKQKNIIKNNIV